MAQKRMFDKELIDCDLFIDLPIPSQCLYFHLSMRADDEGFIGNVKGILRLVGFKDEDLRPLIDRKFIIIFENGVIVIRHWKLNNYLRADRFKETIYKEEKQQLKQDINGLYLLGIPNDNQMATNGVPSIEEKSIEEYSREENRKEEDSVEDKTHNFKKPTIEELKEFTKEHNLKIDEERFIDYYNSNGWVVGKTKMKDWKAAARNWNRKEPNKKEGTREKLERILKDD